MIDTRVPVGILCGGLGTRLSEETVLKPKPMVEIGGKPILWHIMKSYSNYGFSEFALALGYKGEVIKDYFVNYRLLSQSLTVNLESGSMILHNGETDNWVVHLLDTGLNTQTGGRVKRIVSFIGDRTVMLTYGDGVCNLDFRELLEFHRRHGKLATVTAVRPAARFGNIIIDGESVTSFEEKPQVGEGWINGGFFVLEPDVKNYVENDDVEWEREPMERLVADRQLAAYRHKGFWHCVDTQRDKRILEELWESGQAPWRVW